MAMFLENGLHQIHVNQTANKRKKIHRRGNSEVGFLSNELFDVKFQYCSVVHHLAEIRRAGVLCWIKQPF